MYTRNVFFAAVILSIGTLLSGCGGSSASSTSPTPTSSNAELSWSGSANGTYVLDSSGTPYYFSAKTGCMFDKNSNSGPANFCLTPSTSQTSGYTYTGATGCTNPSSNSACNTPQFDVVLTNNPAGTGCIAVLGNGNSSATTIAGAMSVTDTNGSFDIGGTATPSAYKAYWDGAIPICSGNNVYVGTYVSTDYAANGWIVANGQCDTQFPPPTTRSGTLTLTIDSGGIIDSDASKIIGIVANPANTTTMQAAAVTVGANCTPMVTITSVTQNSSSKWVFAGTEALAGLTTPFSATQQ